MAELPKWWFNISVESWKWTPDQKNSSQESKPFLKLESSKLVKTPAIQTQLESLRAKFPIKSELQAKFDSDIQALLDYIEESDASEQDILTGLEKIWKSLDDIEVQEVKSEVQEVKSEVQVKKQAVIEKSEKNLDQIQKSTTEIKEKELMLEEDLKQADKRIQAMYNAFWWEESFKQAVPKFEERKNEAREKLLKDKWFSGPENADKLEKAVLLSALNDSKADIETAARANPEKYQAYFNQRAELWSGINSSLQKLEIPHQVTSMPPITGRNEAERQFQGYEKGDKMIRTGTQFRYGDQVVDTLVQPPKRFIEGSDGLRLESSMIQPPPKEYFQKVGWLELEIQAIKQSSKKQSEELSSDCGKFFLNPISEKNKGFSLQVSPENPKELENKRELLRTAFREELQAAQNSNDAKSIEDIQNISQKVLGKMDQLVEQAESLEKKEWELSELKQQEEKRVLSERERVQSHDQTIRENGKILKSMNISVFVSPGGEADFINLLNNTRWSFWDQDIDLRRWLILSDQKVLANGITKLLWVNLFAEDGVTMKSSTSDGKIIDSNYIQSLLIERCVMEAWTNKISELKMDKLLQGVENSRKK